MNRLFILIMLIPFAGVAQKADFSGKWSLNKRKTDFKQAPDWILPISFEIKQKKDMLVIQAKVYDKETNQHYYTESIPFDGKTSEVLLYNEDRRDVSLRWGYNDSSFILTIRFIKPDNSSGTTWTETWSLEDGGRTLAVDRVAQQADEYSIKAYYNKK